MIGKSSLLLHANTESSADPYFYMNTDGYTLASTFSSISANMSARLSLETASSRTSGTTYNNSTLGKIRTGLYLENSYGGKIQAAVGRNVDTNISSASFALTNSNFSVNLGLINNTTTARQMLFNNKGLFFINGAAASNAAVQNKVAFLSGGYSNRARLVVNGDTGSTTGNTSTATNALVNITTTADTDTGIAPYYTHGGDTKYNYFSVDPSYTSVMNDIKLTSRGGARLSEALPNYILKGIYVLSNSYGSGAWPCGSGNCEFTVPYYSRKALGLSSGGWEFNCGGTGENGSGSHPIVNGGGKCDGENGSVDYSAASKKTVTFSYYASAYKECPSGSFCWAHPFMGAVPAPGRKVSEFGEANKDGLAAYDEGVCPDGYQAVITVTPTAFELGKVQFVNSEKRPSDTAVSYNPGWQNYADNDIADVTGLMQMATRLGVLVEQIKSGTTLYGWKIAMGTVTTTRTNDAGYIWNAGGIPANSWSAVAHTYCYFNPSRFEMPNMVIKDNMIQTAVNPNL